MNSVIMIDFEGKPHRTLPKAIDFHPVSSWPIHVDFLRIGEHTKVHVNVPVRFDNEDASPGLKRGGVLNAVIHELEIVCDAASIPNEIHVPLDGLEIGDSIHISQVKLPEGVTAANQDEDFTVATIVAPSAMKAEEEETAAAGEVPTVEEGEEPEGEGETQGDSGDAVQQALRFYKLDIEALTVFHDELDLAPFKVKVRVGGGLAGHNGLRSIDAALGPEFRRVRVGIGHLGPGRKDLVTRHVLG